MTPPGRGRRPSSVCSKMPSATLPSGSRPPRISFNTRSTTSTKNKLACTHASLASKRNCAKSVTRTRALSRKIGELEARLAKNSTTSSRPPSTDPPGAKKTTSLRQQRGRKVGGQAAHPGATLKPVAQPDQVLVHRPAQCRACSESLADGKVIARRRRQVFDLPPVKLHVVEHQVETKRCRRCGHWTRGMFPDGVDAPVQYGPGVSARAVYLLNSQLIPSSVPVK